MNWRGMLCSVEAAVEVQMRKPEDSGWLNMASHDPLSGSGAMVEQMTLSVPNETFSTISENDLGKLSACSEKLVFGRPSEGHIFPDSKVFDCVDVPHRIHSTRASFK